MDETNTELAKTGSHRTPVQKALWETKTLGIAGMTSDRCVKKIEKAFRRQPGVREIKINREAAEATVTFDSRITNMADLHDLLLRSGYKPLSHAVTA